MAEAYGERRERLRERLAGLDVEAALITSLVNVRYLTGFTGSNGAALITRSSAVLGTDGRYATRSSYEVPDLERVIDRHVAPVLLDRAVKAGIKRLGFESHDVTVDQHADFEQAAEGVELRSIKRAVEDLRTVKDEDEIASLREACAIGDRALAELSTAWYSAVPRGRSRRNSNAG